MSNHLRLRPVVNLLLVFSFLFSLPFVQPAQAAPQPAPLPQSGGDSGEEGPRKGYNPETGMLNFVGGSADAPLAASQVGASAGDVQSAAQQALATYASGFGIQDAARELRLETTDTHEQGVILRYQQQYNGIPVMAGELLVNSDSNGNILSLSGEASPKLALKTTRPGITAEAALTAAQNGMKEWYGLAAGELKNTQPALWIYDERLLGAGTRPPALVWRMDLEPAQELRPINELVLVDAATGVVFAHFNQIAAAKEETLPAKQSELAPVQQTGVIYYVSTTGSDLNTCISPDSPCATINYVLKYVTQGDTIKVASGVYPASVQKRIKLGNKRIILSGGWDEAFETQVGFSTLDGENGEGGMGTEQCYSYCSANITLSNFVITRVAQGYSPLVLIDGYFNISNVSIHHNLLSGVSINNATVTITNTTISDNTAKTNGAGIYIREDSRVTLKNDTITRNTLSQGTNAGSGLYIAYYWVYLTISNTIIAGNDAGGNLDISTYTYFPQAISLGHNLFGSHNENSMIIPAETDLVGQPAGLSPFHPSGYYLPLPGSPALDGGSPADPESDAGACASVDQLGQARPSDGNQDGTARCDIGAVEAIPLNSGENLVAWSEQTQTIAMGKTLNQTPSVLALDANGAPLAGIPVTFSVTSGPGGSFADTGTGTTTVTTGEQGVASAPVFTTAMAPGVTIIEAGSELLAVPNVSFQVETDLPVPTYVLPAGGQKQIAELNSNFANRLQARVLDQHGQPVSGTEVTFAGPESGSTVIFEGSGTAVSSAVTGEDGIATAPEMTSNAVLGKFEVIATTPGASRSAHFTLINGDNLYVSLTGWDTNHPYENDCHEIQDPCATTSWAVDRSKAGSKIYVTAESFKSERGISFNSGPVNVLGGWNQNFTEQVGHTIITGSNIQIAKGVEVTLENFILRNSNSYFTNLGTLNFTNGAFLVSPLSNSGNATLINVTFGGIANRGIYNSSTMLLRNVTMTGFKVAAFNNSGSLTIQNTLIAGNKAICENTGTIISNGHNLIDQNSACKGYPLSGSNGDLRGINPRLSSIVSNQYYALLPGSPAIDQIDPADPGAFCPATDQRGVARPAGDKCDIGAYEYTPHGQVDQRLILSGDNQSFGPGAVLTQRLAFQALDASGTPVPDVAVTYEIPDMAAGSLFIENWEKRWSTTTNESGFAISPPLMGADHLIPYEVTATLDGYEQPIIFHITTKDTVRYVDTEHGSDVTGCGTISTPCLTFGKAYGVSSSGDTIKITASSATTKISLGHEFSPTLSISGGWNSDFTQRTGQTYIDVPYEGLKISSTFLNFSNIDFIGGSTYHPVLTFGVADSSTNFVMLNGTIISNSEIAIENTYQSQIWLANVTITENNCNREYGCDIDGVIVNNGEAIHLNHVTIANNYTIDPKNNSIPALSLPISGNGEVFIQNSLIAQNYYNGVNFSSGENVVSLGHNLIDMGGSLQLAPAEGDIFGTRGNWIQTKLSYPQKIAGQTVLLRPLAGSPALDATDGVACPPNDQQGSVRPAGAQCDIGAVEGAGTEEGHTDRITYIAYKNINLPGIFQCSSSQPGCTNGADKEVDSTHRFTAEFDMFLRTYLNREGMDDHEMAFISTAHKQFQDNSYWTGRQAVFANRFPLADDLVAHEFAHGINTFTARLFNIYQSGAINESLADIWAETYDITDAEEGESSEDIWLIGEGMPDGVFRSMKNPPDYQQPDRMTSKLYTLDFADNGSIHTNSGVGNKAFYLIVEGGTFNKRVITPVGLRKAADIYYYAERTLLTSGANYSDLYQALNQSCRILSESGQGLTPEDCQQVLAATEAVEMNLEPKIASTPDAPFCPTGRTMDPANLFYDDFESGDSQWLFGANLNESQWGIIPEYLNLNYAASGTHAMFGNEFGEESDTYAVWKQPLYIPAGKQTYLHFNHAYAFEFALYHGRYYYFTGGFLEFSVDQGATWIDASRYFNAGKKYNSSVYWGTYRGHNPYAGRKGFVGDSFGYVTSRYNLTALAGKSVLFRWRITTDASGYRLGWAVDDVRVYNCIADPLPPVLLSPPINFLVDTYRPKLSWRPDPSAVKYELQVAADDQFSLLVANPVDLTQSAHTLEQDIPANSRLYWRVRATNRLGVVSAWSKTRYFRTRMRPPAPAAPANHENWPNLRPRFAWIDVPGAVSYTIAISSTPTFRGAFTSTVTTTGYLLSKDLSAGSSMYWRVRANGKSPSAWSDVFDFHTPTPPSTPRLVSPGMNALVTTPSAVTLKWGAVTVPAGAPAFAAYDLQVDDSADFSSLLHEQAGLVANLFTLPDVLPANSKIYWRVRAVNINGEFAWWSASYFRTPRTSP